MNRCSAEAQSAAHRNSAARRGAAARTRVHVLRRQVHQLPRGLAVELDEHLQGGERRQAGLSERRFPGSAEGRGCVAAAHSQGTMVIREEIVPAAGAHQVPDLQHVGVVLVHQLRHVPPADAVKVDLCGGRGGGTGCGLEQWGKPGDAVGGCRGEPMLGRWAQPAAASSSTHSRRSTHSRAQQAQRTSAGAAGALVAHLPKVVLAAKGQHAVGGQVLRRRSSGGGRRRRVGSTAKQRQAGGRACRAPQAPGAPHTTAGSSTPAISSGSSKS